MNSGFLAHYPVAILKIASAALDLFSRSATYFPVLEIRNNRDIFAAIHNFSQRSFAIASFDPGLFDHLTAVGAAEVLQRSQTDLIRTLVLDFPGQIHAIALQLEKALHNKLLIVHKIALEAQMPAVLSDALAVCRLDVFVNSIAGNIKHFGDAKDGNSSFLQLFYLFLLFGCKHLLGSVFVRFCKKLSKPVSQSFQL